MQRNLWSNVADPIDTFESWLLRRVSRAVEAGEVSGDLLSELQDEIAAAHERPRNEQHDLAIQELAEQWGLSVGRVQAWVEALDAQPLLVRDLLLRRFVEGWLDAHQKTYQSRRHQTNDP
jgi:hypothetical protein